MPAERIIAIDFGTSTSVVRVKRYQDGQPLGERLETKPVTFNMGSTVVPTLIQKRETAQESIYFGYDAEIPRRNTEICRNFKIQIEEPDPEVRAWARSLTAEFFSYLFKTYQAQSQDGHLGESGDRERTIISYPVKWNDDTKKFMLETAKNAGFPNVEGQDEAQAAIQAVTVQSEQLLLEQGYFVSGKPVNIMLIDMGAGTTDLVLCRHTPGDAAGTEILATWPHGGFVLFGGSGVDELLRSYIKSRIPAESAEKAIKKLGADKFKAWKEREVSPALARGETVDYFSALDDWLDAFEIDIDYSIDRQIFEEIGREYLQGLPELVNGCLHKGGMSGDDVDLVILTGGHSQWYFVREILSGKLGQFGDVGLCKIQADPKRIISVALPQESVALGLAYSPLRAELSQPTPEPKVKPESDPVKKVGAATSTPESHTSPSVRPTRPSRPERPTRPSLPGKDAGLDEIRGFYRKTQWHTGSCYFLRCDGTVVDEDGDDIGDTRDWNNIVSIAASYRYTVGLRSDGTVVAVGDNSVGQCNVGDWKDIVSIAAGNVLTVGLRSDGTVVYVGSTVFGQRMNVEDWRDIVSIAAGNVLTVGLRSDGTVVAVGSNEFGQCHVQKWNNVLSIASSQNNTYAVLNDGHVIRTRVRREYTSYLFGLKQDTISHFETQTLPFKLF